MQTITEIQAALLKPFSRDDIEFRVCRVSNKSPKACVLAYITARGIMQRLDMVFGLTGWKDRYEVLQTGVKCRLNLNVAGEWICKEDVASFTNIEALKGAFSDSLKRAGVKFGIGRYLYDLPEYWVDLLPDRPANAKNPVHYHSSDQQSGWWVEPDLPQWALPAASPGNAESKSDAKEPVQPAVVSDTSLADKIRCVYEAKLLTDNKYQQLLKTIEEKVSSPALMKHISGQMDLLMRWDEVSKNSQIDTNARKEMYNRILSANGKALLQIRSELDGYQHERAA
jgi:hypothetical protein